MTVTVNHAKTNAISDWTQAQLDEQIALGNFPAGTTLANIVLPSDWNDDHTLTGLGTMAEQDANTVAITGGSVNGTTIGATTASTGAFTTLSSNGTTSLTNGSTNLTFTDGGGTVNPLYVIGQTTGLGRNRIHSQPQLRITVNNNPIQFHTGAGTAAASDGNTQFVVSHTTSAVNYVQVTGAATGGAPTISAQGSDATVAMLYRTKGNGVNHSFQNGSGNNGLVVTPVTSTVNYTQISSAITTQVPLFQTLGSDTNISMAFQPKGTGAIDLAAGSRGVNISNGGTVTAITRTAAGTGYTSVPTVNITAPTTAGGVQAVITIPSIVLASPGLASGGTGYTVGNVLTLSGGTFTTAATITVTSVSAGVITGVSISNNGVYTVAPAIPASVTGGSGSGATFNVSFGINSNFSIGTAGSGYIEQPTITFSGGGGSGAAAYATVGSGTTVKSIGSTMSFSTPNGETFRVSDNNATAVNYWAVSAGTASANPLISVGGSGTNISQTFNTKGTGVYQFSTGSALQYQIAHTASAVNYVQVTGGATGGNPTISVQGSDANAGFIVASKGTGLIRFDTGTTTQFRILNTASAINRIDVTGSAAGAAPSFACSGTDTNIDLALTPKGTGLVRFGAYVAGALTATGYINIKAADGTTYKVLVST